MPNYDFLLEHRLLTGLQSIGSKGAVNLTVVYEEATGKKEVVLRHNLAGETFMALDEFSEMIIKNCASDMKYDDENGYKVLTVCIKE